MMLSRCQSVGVLRPSSLVSRGLPRRVPTSVHRLSTTKDRLTETLLRISKEKLAKSAEEKQATSSLLSDIVRDQRERRPLDSGQPSTLAPPRQQQHLRPSPAFPERSQAEREMNESIFGNHNPATQTAADKTLFDVFQVPDPPPPPPKPVPEKERSPNAYPEAAFQEYMEIVDSLWFREKHRRDLTEEQVEALLAWFSMDEPSLDYKLPTYQLALKEGVRPLSGDTGKYQEQALVEQAQQRAYFIESRGFTALQYRRAEGFVAKLSQVFAKKGKGVALDVLWSKAKESGMASAKLLHTMLYVSSTFWSGNSRRKRRSKYGHLAGMTSILDVLDTEEIGDDDEDEEENLIDMTDEIAILHDILYPPTEQSINIRVKLLVAQGKAKEAEQLLTDHSSGEAALRLRAFTPVLRLFLELGDLASALSLYKKMKTMSLVHLDVETYIHILAGLTEQGTFRPNGDPISSAFELGYAHASGPGLFDEIAQEMAGEIFEIPEASAKRLYNALADGFPDSGLENTTSLSPLRLTYEPAPEDVLFANRVPISSSTGICPRSGVKLRLIHLNQEEKNKLMEGVLTLATAQHKKFNAKNDMGNRNNAREELLRFYNWLERREGRPYTVIVDGANVGYYQQNFEGGKYNFYQLQFVVDELERLGERPLIVVPFSYSRDIFQVSASAGNIHRQRQRLSRPEKQIRNKLMQTQRMYCVAPGCLDDYYWIVASVCSQKESTRGRSLEVLPEDPRGRWPGTRPALVTNDLMRDHQLMMLQPMIFRRWFSNYIVNYNFPAFVDDKCAYPEIGFSPTDFFSREIQGNRDEKGTMVWHFPLVGVANEWFCIRLPADKAATEKRNASRSN